MVTEELVNQLVRLIDVKDSGASIAFLEQHPEVVNADLGPLLPELGPRDKVIHAVAETGLSEVLRYLLDHGVDPNTRDSTGGTPLWLAAWRNNPECIELLLERGADIEAMDQEGRTAIDFAYGESFELLLRRGAKPGLFIAAARDRIDILEQLLRGERMEELLRRLPNPDDLFRFAEISKDRERMLELLRAHGFREPADDPIELPKQRLAPTDEWIQIAPGTDLQEFLRVFWSSPANKLSDYAGMTIHIHDTTGKMLYEGDAETSRKLAQLSD